MLTGWYLYVPGVVIVLCGIAIFRWLQALQARVNDHAERISHIEGKHEGS